MFTPLRVWNYCTRKWSAGKVIFCPNYEFEILANYYLHNLREIVDVVGSHANMERWEDFYKYIR